MVDNMHNINKSRQEATYDELPVYEHAHSFKTKIKEICRVEFYNFLKPNEPIIFATVGSNIVSIYECQQDHIKEVQKYIDPNNQEMFYTCSWSLNPYSLDAILAFGGKHGIIKMIYPLSATAAPPLRGHCGIVNELKFHPKEPSILLSASGDKSLRLWNIESGRCMAVFGGVHGHLDMVMSADFDSAGNRIISCGMDHALKIWRLDKSPIKEVIIRSFHELLDNRPLRIYQVHFPDYSTINIHQNHVDCVKWYGNFVLSRSLENEIVLWIPDSSVVHSFDVKHCTYLYMRFAMDSSQKYMAIGNAVGEIYLWALNRKDPTKYTVLKNKKCTRTVVRHTAFSQDGKVIICVCDDTTVHRYNKK